MPRSRSITSAGTTSAPSASPERTFAIASSRVSTRIGSTASNSSDAYTVASSCSPPRLIWASSGGTRLANATFGLDGPDESAAPTSSATTIG